jgi:ABC-type transporter Mla maintaining outer membrane lipid asymmetry ATPase subunit MlaF
MDSSFESFVNQEHPKPGGSNVVISLRDLHVCYGDREILHGIHFDVKAGETLVILGGSGSGKSTLLRTLVGLEKPSSGQIWINGQDIAAISNDDLYEIRKKTGMSFQGGALFGSMTVGENVALPLREHTKLEESTIEIMLRLKLEQVGLAGFEYHMPSQLRRNEKAGRRRKGSRDGSGDSIFRRTLGWTGSHYRGRYRSVDLGIKESVSYDDHRGYP